MWNFADLRLESRLIVGSSAYPSPEQMCQSILASGAGMVTVSLRRQSPGSKSGAQFWKMIKGLNITVLPNTAGCRNAKEAINIAYMAREIFNTNLIKLEVVADDYNLHPDPFELTKAAEQLVNEGFIVFPYTTTDLSVATKLLEVGCRIIMPWAAPIGTGRGIVDICAMRALRARLPEATLIVDAGLGLPSHAAAAMELGFDGVLLNSAIALAADPVTMAGAFKLAVESGRQAFLAGPMEQRETAVPSTPVVGTPFWHAAPTNKERKEQLL